MAAANGLDGRWIFGLGDDRKAIVEGIGRTIEAFDDAYWLERDRDGEFPHAFYDAIAEGGLARDLNAGGRNGGAGPRRGPRLR